MDQTLPARLSSIESAIAAASTPEDCKQVIALADAAVAFAKSLGKEYQDALEHAKRVKAEALRRLGEILKATPMAPAGRPKINRFPLGTNFEKQHHSGVDDTQSPEQCGDKESVPGGNRFPGYADGAAKRPATLKELGISKKISMQAQRLASMSDEEFEDVAAGKAPIAPPPKPKEEPKQSYVDQLEQQVDDLKGRIEQMQEAHAEALAIAENAQAVIDGDEHKRLMLLEAKLRAAEQSRDIAMRENAQLKRQVKGLQAQLRRAA